MDIYTLCNNSIHRCERCCVDKDSKLELTVFCEKCRDKGRKELAEEILKNNIIYVVNASEVYDDFIVKTYFLSLEKAEKYVEIQSQLEDGYNYWITEEYFYDDKVNLDDKVVDYFEYFIYLNEPLDYIENFDFNDRVKRIYDKDLSVKIEDDIVYVWSINSLAEAKQRAIEIYKEKND